MAEMRANQNDELCTYRNDIDNRITKRENISTCNRARVLGIILTPAFCRPGYGTGGGLEILVHMSTEHAIPPPEQNLPVRERRLHRLSNLKRPRSTSTGNRRLSFGHEIHPISSTLNKKVFLLLSEFGEGELRELTLTGWRVKSCSPVNASIDGYIKDD